jgi:hypothetical protein
MKDKQMKHFGKDFTDGEINFPKYLTPEIIHTALFVHNAKDKEEMVARVEYCAKQIGDEAMSYAMSLLVLPYLIDKAQESKEYKDYMEEKKRKYN